MNEVAPLPPDSITSWVSSLQLLRRARSCSCWDVLFLIGVLQIAMGENDGYSRGKLEI